MFITSSMPSGSSFTTEATITRAEADEIEGLDLPEMGMLAYPEFMGSHIPGLEDQQVADPGGTELNV